MLGHRDPGVRQVAAWALGRTGDLDVVPDLIDAFLDADAKVAASARQGLQLISRKIDGPAAADPVEPRSETRRGRRVESVVRTGPTARPLGTASTTNRPRPSRGGRRHERQQPPTTESVTAPSKTFEPRVLGESPYDRVTSFLMAVVLGAFLVVGWLGLVFASNQEYTTRVTSPLHIIEVFGGGGGSPDGTPGSTEQIDLAGADAASQASNNEETPGDFEQPSVQTTPGAMLDAAARRRSAGRRDGHRPGDAQRRRRRQRPSGPRRSAPAVPAWASVRATAASAARTAGASSSPTVNDPRSTPANSTPWGSSWPSSRARIN